MQQLHTAEACYAVFQRSIDDYHRIDQLDATLTSPYHAKSFDSLLYSKNWIDTVQWHLEDLIRSPEIEPREALRIKRRIDRSNQDRTDTVERIDDFFVEHFLDVIPQADARLNSETPAWLLDRMSILLLKIYHMREQVERTDTDASHRATCSARLSVLMEQRSDMALAYDQLLEDIVKGRRRIKVYRQMKMYNDETLNPVLYSRKK